MQPCLRLTVDLLCYDATTRRRRAFWTKKRDPSNDKEHEQAAAWEAQWVYENYMYSNGQIHGAPPPGVPKAVGGPMEPEVIVDVRDMMMPPRAYSPCTELDMIRMDNTVARWAYGVAKHNTESKSPMRPGQSLLVPRVTITVVESDAEDDEDGAAVTSPPKETPVTNPVDLRHFKMRS